MDAIPCSSVLKKQNSEIRRLCSARGGDDYELCFTAHLSQNSQIESISRQLKIPLTCIGSIVNKKDGGEICMILKDQSGKNLSVDETNKLLQSFDHFHPSS
jgi:thiamine-monophosphate kinase